MASKGVEPVAAHPLAARRALAEHLRRGDVPDGVTIDQIDDLALHVGILARPLGDAEPDRFVLRLGFSHYDAWPPSAQFINPDTGSFVLGEDNRHLPRIVGSNELQVHPSYDNPAGGQIQLICSSATLEFYVVRHGVEDKHIWQEGTHTLWTTIGAVRHHLRGHWYEGRFA